MPLRIKRKFPITVYDPKRKGVEMYQRKPIGADEHLIAQEARVWGLGMGERNLLIFLLRYYDHKSIQAMGKQVGFFPTGLEVPITLGAFVVYSHGLIDWCLKTGKLPLLKQAMKSIRPSIEETAFLVILLISHDFLISDQNTMQSPLAWYEWRWTKESCRRYICNEIHARINRRAPMPTRGKKELEAFWLDQKAGQAMLHQCIEKGTKVDRFPTAELNRRYPHLLTSWID